MSSEPFFMLLLCLIIGIAADRYEPFPDDMFAKGEVDILKWNKTKIPGMQDSALSDRRMKWPGGKVFFKFHSSLSQSEQNMLAQAMKEIHDKTCVRFHNVGDHNNDFVLIFKPPHDVCNSFVGRTGGKQQLNLGPDCYHRSVILHELMHALGFVHEHTRSDRDQHVTINWGNVVHGQAHNFEKRDREDLTLMDTPYSFSSIMHYSERLFSKDGYSKTIVPKRQVSNIGGGQALSPIDVERINKYYGCGKTSEPHQEEEEKVEEEKEEENNWHQQHQRWLQQKLNEWRERVQKFKNEVKNEVHNGCQVKEQRWQEGGAWYTQRTVTC